MDHLKKGKDYYYSEDGYVVFTEKYHLRKGDCCGNGCRHCPYDYINTPESQRKNLQQKKAAMELAGQK